MRPSRNTRARFVLTNKMAELYQEILNWLDTMSGLMRALPVTPANSEAMAKMYTTMFQMVQTFAERFPIAAGVGSVMKPPAAPASTALISPPKGAVVTGAPPTGVRPIELLRAAAALRLPEPPVAAQGPEQGPAPWPAPPPAVQRPSAMDIVHRAEAAPAGAEESEEERPVTNKISLRQHGYHLDGKDKTRFAALEKARAAHGSGTVLNRLKMLQKIWKTCDHPRSGEFQQNIIADIAYLREMDRRAAGRGDA